MRARADNPARMDLSRLSRLLGGEVRRHLDTSPGYPIHHRAPAELIRRVRAQLKHPDPTIRARALAKLRRRILGHTPHPPHWRDTTPPRPPCSK